MEKRIKNTAIFLAANWQYLAMINYEVDPEVLQKHIPSFTEIDYFDGKALVSLVGFLFNDTRVLGLRIPFHINFEEVNLRYYIKRFDGSDWKRGVGFISEIVPKVCVARLANTLYNEHYSVARMSHDIKVASGEIKIYYSWKKRRQQENYMQIKATDLLQDIKPLSAEAFILEHYFGYNQLNASTVIEYAVEHPRWQVYPVKSFELSCDVENLYGKDFVPFIKDQKPHSVFLAQGSEIIVRKPVYIRK